MPILLLLLTVAATLPSSRVPRPEWLTPLESLVFTILSMSMSVLITGLKCRATVRRLERTPSQRSGIAKSYLRFRQRMPMVTLGLAIISVVVWGWSDTVAQYATLTWRYRVILFPGAELLVPLPYFVALFFNWICHHSVERALHHTANRNENEADAGFWSLTGYLSFQTRQLLLILGLPIGVSVGNQTLARLFPVTMATDEMQWLGLVVAIGLFLFFPRIVPLILGLAAIPPGPARTQLDATSKRIGIRFTNLLLWPTRGLVVNALVIGVLRPARYVIFTDRILESLTPRELDAVFGHEAGHVRHGHLAYYVVFLMLSAAFLGALSKSLENLAEMFEWTTTTHTSWTLLPLVLMGLWLFVGFGWLSRRCERQADVAGARAGSCDQPNCPGHFETTTLGNGRTICRTGANAMIAALDRVADTGGHDRGQKTWRERLGSWFAAWQHGPMSYRIEFLMRLAENPKLADEIDRRAYRFRWLLALALLAGAVLFSSFVGYTELLQTL
jgi:STE24 endopeptidase